MSKQASRARVVILIKRDKSRQAYEHPKLLSHLAFLARGLELGAAEVEMVATKVSQATATGMTTHQLVELAADTAHGLVQRHPAFSSLAGRILMSRIRRDIPDTFSEAARHLFSAYPTPLLSEETYGLITKHASRLDAAIRPERDMDYDYHGLRVMIDTYLIHSPITSSREKAPRVLLETPQYMLMRVSIGLHGDDIEAAMETYELLSRRQFIHATPTMAAAGTPVPQLGSCFLLTMQSDSLEGIFNTAHQCAKISKAGGGIGLSVSNIRGKGDPIRGINGRSSGLVPWIKVLDQVAASVNQGGRRDGAIKIFTEPWHMDFLAVLDLKKPGGSEDVRARHLSYCVWMNDLFFERLEVNGTWSFFSPMDAPLLQETYGASFKEAYEAYEAQGLAVRTMPATQVMEALCMSIQETSGSVMSKDACNRLSNHNHLGTIKGSNLCTEIVEYSAPDEVAVCNLASASLPAFVRGEDEFDYEGLHALTKVITRNLNKTIDRGYYPIEEARRSNLRHRPIAIGVQGLADVFAMMQTPFDSPKAREINRRIFETIYHAALEASCELAQAEGPYSSYEGSMVSRGLLHIDHFQVTHSGLWDWEALRASIRKHGVRNSLLVAPMPTSTTSAVLFNNESFEPFSSNLYTRNGKAGSLTIINRHLVRDLTKLNLWSNEMSNLIILGKGSIQGIEGIPDELKLIYRTSWEIPKVSIIEMARDRAVYIDQSMSMNMNLADATASKISFLLRTAWEAGLKTLTYYLKCQVSTQALNFAIDPSGSAMIKHRSASEPQPGPSMSCDLLGECTGCSA
jgi:ribonucleoside-diphosphate reductase alpha subunit